MVPEGLAVQHMPRDEFTRYAVEMAGEPYQAYGILGSQVEATQAADPALQAIQS